MRILICERCNELHEPPRVHCLCHTPYDPMEVRRRHEAAVEAARVADRLDAIGAAPADPLVERLAA